MYSYFDFLNEFNKKDRYFIKELSDNFTLSVEYEVVADFPIEKEPKIESKKDFKKAKGFAKEQTLLDLSRGQWGRRSNEKYRLSKSKLLSNEERMKDENDLSELSENKLLKLHQKYLTWTYVNNILDSVLDLVQQGDDEDIYSDLMDDYQKMFKDKITNYIINRLDININKFVFKQNMHYLKKMMLKYLPNFTKKWGDAFKYELESDADKQRILEFSSKSYVDGLNKCLEQVDDFYNDMEKQKFWKMNERTGLHVNIGFKKKNIRWNPIKGLLIMSDMNRDRKTPFVFTDIMWRLQNRFTQSLLDSIKKNLTGEIEKDYITDDDQLLHDLKFRDKEALSKHKKYLSKNIDKLDLHNIDQVEDTLNSFILKANNDFYIKEFGIKLVELDTPPGFVEFRYVGGDVNRDVFKDKILYFCYIVYLMTNEDYKKKEYQKKLYKYVEDLKQLIS